MPKSTQLLKITGGSGRRLDLGSLMSWQTTCPPPCSPGLTFLTQLVGFLGLEVCSRSLLLGMRSELFSLMFFWDKLVWHSMAIPRHAFIVLLAIKNGQYKLKKWDIIPQAKSLMCNDPIETIDHLFFSCPVAKGVGATVYNQCCLNTRSPGCWESELLWAANQFKGKGFPSLVRKIAWGATIYHIWRERNARLYKTEYK